VIFVDTGYLIALTDPDDALHARALAWARCVRGPYVTTDGVVLEFFSHFAGPVARPRALAVYDRIRLWTDWTSEPMSRDVVDAGIALFRARPDKYWSLTDCTSFVVMADRRMTQALAYDHHFEQAGFEALLRRDPP